MRNMMRRTAALMLALTLPAAALADPVLSNGTQTAYIGESNWLYLQTSDGRTLYMAAPMQDLPGMSDTAVTCYTAGGALWQVQLDGSSSSVISQFATEAMLLDAAQHPWSLCDGVFTYGNMTAENVQAACTNGISIYFVQRNDDGSLLLRSIPLDGVAQLQPVYALGTTPIVTMTATGSAVAIVTEGGEVLLLNLTIQELTHEETVMPDTVAAMVLNGTLYRYTQDENGAWVYADATPLDAARGFVERAVDTASSNPTASPTAKQNAAAVTARPTAIPAQPTARPTARPTAKPTARSTSAPEDDTVIRKGDRGSAVKKMQRRLIELGYPLSKADGVFGEETLYALNLFQFAIGYKERTYASEACQNKLYAKSAPIYNPYMPLKQGNSGTPVLLMQERLLALGYAPGKLDGIYGKQTVIAVLQFLIDVGLEGDGTEATQEMLLLLYDPALDPVFPGAPTAHPSVPPTEPPAAEPTPMPTAAPTPGMEEPTPMPTAAPTLSPTEEPTSPPTEAPTAAPTVAPTPAPTEAPTPAPTDPPAEADT